MKNSLIILLFIALTASLQAQQGNRFQIGLKAGLSTTSLETDQIRILDQGGIDRLELAVKDAKYGFHAGLVIRAQFNKFILQPELLFNSSQVDYEVDDLIGGNVITTTLNESYQYLDIPILAGFKLGPLRLQAGPVGHIFLGSDSELNDLPNIDYRQKFEDMTLGWQGNIGLDIWNLMLDFRYEGNFTKFGNHINFAGRQYQFDDTPSRWIASVGFLF